jgi:hypothetical protein
MNIAIKGQFRHSISLLHTVSYAMQIHECIAIKCNHLPRKYKGQVRGRKVIEWRWVKGSEANRGGEIVLR